MNTFVRGPMRNEGGGLLSAEIRLPDIYGIFDFVVKFQEPGFQSIDQKFSITINPIRNGILEFFPKIFFRIILNFRNDFENFLKTLIQNTEKVMICTIDLFLVLFHIIYLHFQ